MSEEQRAQYLATTTDKGNKRYATTSSRNMLRAVESMLKMAIKGLIFASFTDVHGALLVFMCNREGF